MKKTIGGRLLSGNKRPDELHFCQRQKPEREDMSTMGVGCAYRTTTTTLLLV
jgi:hypothetical protein